MQFVVTFATGIYSQLPKIMSKTQIFTFGYRPVYISDSKTVRVGGYFSKPKKSASRNVWETLSYTLQKTPCPQL